MKMETAVEIDEDKIDEAALALFYLTLHDKFGRAWKQIDWSITDRLYEARSSLILASYFIAA